MLQIKLFKLRGHLEFASKLLSLYHTMHYIVNNEKVCCLNSSNNNFSHKFNCTKTIFFNHQHILTNIVLMKLYMSFYDDV